MSTDDDPAGAFRDRLQLAFEAEPVCVVLRPRGAFSPDAGLAWIRIAASDPRYAPGMSIIYDLTELDADSLTGQMIREYVQRIRDNPQPAADKVRVAFVAPTPVAFGMLRMFETVASFEVPRDRAVFRTMEEARDWLRGQRERS